MATSTKNTAAPELYNYEYSNTLDLTLSFRGTAKPFSNLQLFNDKNLNGVLDNGEFLANTLVGANSAWNLNVKLGILASDSSFNFRSVENDGANLSEVVSLTYNPPKPVPLAFSLDQTEIFEPNSSNTTRSVTYSLTGTPNATVNLQNLGTAAVGGDLSFTPVNLQVISANAANQSAQILLDALGKASFTLTATQDNLQEGNETILVSATDNTDSSNHTLASSVVVHDFQQSNLSIFASRSEVFEPHSDPTTSPLPSQVTVTISGGTPNSVINLSNTGTAIVGQDLSVLPVTFEWLEASISQQSASLRLNDLGSASFTLAAQADTLTEGDESLNFKVVDPQNPSSNALAQPIILHDQTSNLKISHDQNIIFEVPGALNTNTANYTISGGLPNAIVTLKNSGTAIIGNDAFIQPGTLNWLSADIATQTASIRLNAQGALSFSVIAAKDTQQEGDENVILSVTDANSSTNNALATAVTIRDSAELNFSVASLDVSEGNSNGQNQALLSVSLSTASTETTTVNFSTVDGTAIAGSDYQATTGALTFAPGETSKTVPILIIGDTVVEADESFSVKLTDPSGNAILGAVNTANVNIKNDDFLKPSISFDRSGVSVQEGNGGNQDQQFANLLVQLSSAATQPITVTYQSQAGSATGTGIDYTDTSGVLTFAPGETSKSIQVPITGDLVIEPDENLTFALSNPSENAVLGSIINSNITIINDDTIPLINFNNATLSVPEGNGNTQTLNQATLTVTLSSAATQNVTVNYRSSDGTANSSNTSTASDYQASSGTLTFAPGETSKTINIPIVGDTQVEPNETFSVALTNPSSNAALGATSNATVTITNDDFIPTLTFQSANISVQEGNGGSQTANQATLTLELSSAATQPVTVDTSTSNGTAIGNSTSSTVSLPADYQSSGGTVTFAPGETSKTINISIFGDTTIEADENFSVNLSNLSSNAQLVTPSSATVIILNDDFPVVSFLEGSIQLFEGNGGTQPLNQAVLDVILSTAYTQTVTVNYATSDGVTGSNSFGAFAPSDYLATSGTLSFAPGETTKSISVPIVGDNVFEPNEDFFITLTGVSSNATLGSPSVATVAILDEDG